MYLFVLYISIFLYFLLKLFWLLKLYLSKNMINQNSCSCFFTTLSSGAPYMHLFAELSAETKVTRICDMTCASCDTAIKFKIVQF